MNSQKVSKQSLSLNFFYLFDYKLNFLIIYGDFGLSILLFTIIYDIYLFGSKLSYHYFIINIQTMPRNMLEKIGVLFPFTNFLRIGNEMEMTSSCGGISAIIVIIGVIGIFASELVTVFQMKTITSSS